MLYLGYIPLNDDCSMWDYSVVNNYIFVAKNLWGLYAYGITDTLMSEILEQYREFFPMELDRYFVTYIQPRNLSFGITPQIFGASDGFSDNSHKMELNMPQRSIDPRFANINQYI